MNRSSEPAYATSNAASPGSSSGAWSVAVVSSGSGGNSFRTARTAVSATAATRTSTFFRKTSRSVDRSNSASTSPFSRSLRPAAAESTVRSFTFASSNGSAAPCRAVARPAGAGAVTA